MQKNKTYDLEERTTTFSKEIIIFCQKSRKDIVTTPLVTQLVRSGTSIGANYCEANGASSKKDFVNKIFICKKESKETQYWLKILSDALPENKDKLSELWQEAKELAMIFSAIASKSKCD